MLSGRVLLAWLCLTAMGVGSSLSFAQEAASTLPATSPAVSTEMQLGEQRAKTEEELASLQSQISLSQARKEELDKEIANLETDRASINRNLIETSTRSRAIEERIARSAVRLEELRGNEAVVRQSLQSRRGILIEVIAALQRMGHKPPPAILVTPEDALSSVRAAILLGAVVPEIRSETQILATELKNLVQITTDIAASRDKLSEDLTSLAEDERRLTLLLEEKKNLSISARNQLAEQTALAAQLAGKAGNLQNLISQLETQLSSVRNAAEAARKAEEERRSQEEQMIASAREDTIKPDFLDTARIAPAMSFAKAKGLLPKPVSGVELASFNQRTVTGDLSQGLSIATRSASRVVAPADGWVIYAGPFRSYGQLLILNAGDGYHVVLSGMDRINVELGQFVLTGEPVGIMGASRVASNKNVDVGSARPVLYVEFRKDGTSIDPAPWWVKTSLEERNG